MRFWYHYNKPASKAAKRVRWSLHYRGVCHIVDKLICKAGTESRVRKRQPYGVIAGDAVRIDIKDGVAFIQ